MLLLLFLLSLSVFLYAFLSPRPKGPVKEGRPSIVGLFGAVGWNFSLQVFAAQTQTGKEKGLAECQSSFLPEKQQNSSISHPSQDTQAGSVSTVISSSTPRKRAHQVQHRTSLARSSLRKSIQAFLALSLWVDSSAPWLEFFVAMTLRSVATPARACKPSACTHRPTAKTADAQTAGLQGSSASQSDM